MRYFGWVVVILAVVSPDLDADKSTKISAPDIEFYALAQHDGLTRGSPLNVTFWITNRSGIAVSDLNITAFPRDSEIHLPIPAIASLSPFQGEVVEVKASVDNNASFQTYHELYILRYTWKSGCTNHQSTQKAMITVTVNRQFEEEAKGLPGGTAALLYWVLPVMVLFLAYGSADSLRHGRMKIPEFKSEYIATAFLLAILFNFIMALAWHHDETYLYSSPRRLVVSIAVLTAIGTTYPFASWLLGILFFRFRPGDSPYVYLRKALHQAKNGQVRWVGATIGGVAWEGVLLHQPSGAKLLGVCLQVNPDQVKISPDTLKQIVDENGKISDRKRLLRYVKSGRAKLDIYKKIRRSNQQMDNMLFVEDENLIENLDRASIEPIVRFVG